MSRFNYKNHKVVKRTETIEVATDQFPAILQSNDLNRVQKVMSIRDAVRDSYISEGYKDVAIRFINGTINDLIDASKLEGRPIPTELFFEVELEMPLVHASDVPVGLKSESAGCRNYKNYGAYRQNDHIYWQ